MGVKMNLILSFRLQLIIYILLSTFFSISLSSQDCSVHGIDNGDHQFTFAAGARLGQTFIACQDGTLDTIKVNLLTSGNYDLWVCTPNGTPIDDALKSSFVVTNVGVQSIPLIPPVEVLSGTLYEFQLTNSSQNFTYRRHGGPSGVPPGDYPLGNRTSNGNNTIADLDFDVIISSASVSNPLSCSTSTQVVAVPTLSTWALIVLALMLSIIGITSQRQIALN